MTTLTSMVEQKRAEMDTAWQAENPDGMFSIQRFQGHRLHWYCNRPVSGHVRCNGVSAEIKNNEVHLTNHRTCSFGVCTYYTGLDKFRRACDRFGVDPNMARAFLAAYEHRRLTGESPKDFY